MMNQSCNVRWQFVSKADWAGSFFKGTSNYSKHTLDAHKKSWQHLARVLAKQEANKLSSH